MLWREKMILKFLPGTLPIVVSSAGKSSPTETAVTPGSPPLAVPLVLPNASLALTPGPITASTLDEGGVPG